MVNSRAKGKKGELEWAHYLSDKGHPAERGRQHQGGDDSPDVKCKTLPFHFEVKRVQRLQLHDAMTQAEGECGDRIPVVAHRRNKEEWKITMNADDFFHVYNLYHSLALQMNGNIDDVMQELLRRRT